MSHKKMTKTDDTDSWAGGVIGGICKHYGLDPFLFRIAYLALLIGISSFFILVYCLLYLLMPEECEAKKD